MDLLRGKAFERSEKSFLAVGLSELVRTLQQVFLLITVRKNDRDT